MDITSSLWLSWGSGVTRDWRDDGALVVTNACSSVSLESSIASVFTVITDLGQKGVTEDELISSTANLTGVNCLSRVYFYLRLLIERALLVRSVQCNECVLATLLPITQGMPVQLVAVPLEQRIVLSRFAFVQFTGGQAVLESPCAKWRVLLHDSRLTALVHDLSQPLSALEASRRFPDMDEVVAQGVLTLLFSSGLALNVEADNSTSESRDAALASWEFHDLLFHTRSRKGRTDLPFGATYSLGSPKPPPAVKFLTGQVCVQLERPDLPSLEERDPPFAWVTERRASIRDYSDEPITRKQLGEFLFRTARVKDLKTVRLPMLEPCIELELASRPYPSGGALCELEVYAVIQKCTGIAPGFYHYNPVHHHLIEVCSGRSEMERLLNYAALCAGMPVKRLQILFIYSARFQRITWKYSGLAYSLVMKHVGILQHTMYLAATAMGLAPCALGAGDSDEFANAIGSHYYTETSVGEFLLGSVCRSPAPQSNCGNRLV
jgi:SagB-type dehydrogenase family enzyme